jgi:hypothetical protein
VLATGAATIVFAALAFGLLAASGRAVETRSVRALALPSDPFRLSAPSPTGESPSLDLSLPPSASPALALELDVRPLWRDWESAGTLRPSLLVAFDDAPAVRSEDVPERGTWRVALPPSARRVRVASADPRVDAVVTGARTVGEERPFAESLAAAAFLLFLGMSCAVPFAVFLSRGVTGPAAVAATALVLFLGVTHESLLGLAADVEAKSAWPAAVLRSAAFLSPDLSGLSAVSDAARGRAVRLDLPALVPAFLHAGVFLVAVALGRRGRP